jgi:hypothetical protein
MNTEPEHPATRTRAASERRPEPVPDSEAAQRADVEEDRRRQRDLDDGELGGEA